MIRRLQARNYRCLRHVDLRLDRFQVLVGPNASGKSTVLDAVGFLGDLVTSGVEAAVERRSPDFRDLVWARPEGGDGLGFELAAEFDLSDGDPAAPEAPPDDRVFRYEVAIRQDDGTPRIARERGLLGRLGGGAFGQRRRRFPDPQAPPETIFVNEDAVGYRPVLTKSGAGRSRIEPESQDRVAEAWAPAYAVGGRRSALSDLSGGPDEFPAATRSRRLLTGTRRLFLDSAALRRPSPPAPPGALSPDGSNLPWLARELRAEDERRFAGWLRQARCALPDVADVRVVVSDDEDRAHLMIRYDAGFEIPSWAVSEGTLRFLALSLVLFLPAPEVLYLIEEPEDGVYPLLMQDVGEALSPVHGPQVVVATHSPAMLTEVEPKNLLCFAKDASGAPDVIPVTAHPDLGDWDGVPRASALFAAGALE